MIEEFCVAYEGFGRVNVLKGELQMTATRTAGDDEIYVRGTLNYYRGAHKTSRVRSR
jgi:hypothetical protein